MKKHSKFTVTLAAAMVAVLVLASVAVAQTIDSGILARLFQNGQPSQQAIDLLQTDLADHNANGLNLHVDELLFDGRSVNCQWTLTSDRPDALFVLTDYEIVGVDENLFDSENSRGASSSTGVGDNTLTMLDAAKDSLGRTKAQEYLSVNFTQPLTAPAQLVLTLTAFTTDLTPTALDELYPDGTLCAAMEQAGQIGVYDGYAWLSEYPAFAAALEQTLPADDSTAPNADAWARANLDAHTASSLMTQEFVTTITLPLEVVEAGETTFPAQTFELDDCTLEISGLSFTAASTTMEMKVYPKAKMEEADFLNKYRFAIGAQDQVWLMDLSGALETDESGRQVYMASLSGQPVVELPDEIVFVLAGEAPVTQYEQLIGEQPEGRTAVMKLK